MAAARGNDRGKMSRSLRARTRLSRGKILINAVIVGTRTIGTIYYIIYILIASRFHRNTMPRTCTVTTGDFPKKHGLTAKNVKPSHTTHRGPILPVPSSCIQLHVHNTQQIDTHPGLYYYIMCSTRAAGRRFPGKSVRHLWCVQTRNGGWKGWGLVKKIDGKTYPVRLV